MKLNLENCTGVMRWSGNEIPITFTVTCDEKGEVQFDIADIPMSSETVWIFDLIDQKGQFVEPFAVIGQDDNGRNITTDKAYISFSSHSHSADNGSFFKIKTKVNYITWGTPISEITIKENQYHIVYLTIGLQCLDTLKKEHKELGEITVQGSSKIEDYNELHGFIAFTSPNDVTIPLNEWIEACDRQVRWILDIFSFALGHYISWNIREVYDGDVIIPLLGAV